MQRAAASSPTTPDTPSLPSAKRQKLSDTSSPATPTSELQIMRAATAAEEARRAEALERQAADAGETKWVLSFRDEAVGTENGVLQVLKTGYADLDTGGNGQNQEEEPWGPKVVGRRSFGKFNRALEVRTSHPKSMRNQFEQ